MCLAVSIIFEREIPVVWYDLGAVSRVDKGVVVFFHDSTACRTKILVWSGLVIPSFAAIATQAEIEIDGTFRRFVLFGFLYERSDGLGLSVSMRWSYQVIRMMLVGVIRFAQIGKADP